jgi:DNA-binding response OmpR family regulator
VIRVLFIDDDPGAQDTLRWILAGRYAVVPAYSAAEGLSLLAEQDPDVVLLDIELPDRDGLSLLEDILARPAPPPVIMLTGHGKVDFVKRPCWREPTISS